MNAAYPQDDNGDALRRLAEAGSDMSLPMWIDFMIAIPSGSVGNEIGAEAERLGYAFSVEQDPESKEWTCYCRREMIATYPAIVAAQSELEALARRHNGYIDGWGSFGNANAS